MIQCYIDGKLAFYEIFIDTILAVQPILIPHKLSNKPTL